MSKYFGTDGFRGKAGIDLTVDHAFKVGRFIGWYYSQENKAKIVIGKDTRRSSYMFECALAAGITSSGADVYLMHVTTTPSVSYITRTDDFACGIMISASHNPYFDNGIKLLNCNGEKMEESVIDKVEEYLSDSDSFPIAYATDDAIGRVIDYSSGRNRYIGYLISLATTSYKGYRIGLDCANGSTWQIAKSVFDALGADTYVIANQPDGINVNNGCGSTHIENLQRYVRENHLDVGFAFDGDADRCLAVDEKGDVVTGDHIMYVCGCFMKEKGELTNNKVVTTVMSNFGLYKALESKGIGYEKTDVGDKYVYENMRANGHVLGGEQSGHIIFGKYANTGDGMLTAIKIMQVICEKKISLSKLAESFQMLPQVLKNARVVDKNTALEDEYIKKVIAQVGEELGDTGRVMVRPSGTEPVIRVMSEAPTHEECERCVDAVIQAMDDRHVLIEVKK